MDVWKGRCIKPNTLVQKKVNSTLHRQIAPEMIEYFVTYS